jgi:hypothetical protein
MKTATLTGNPPYPIRPYSFSRLLVISADISEMAATTRQEIYFQAWAALRGMRATRSFAGAARGPASPRITPGRS